MAADESYPDGLLYHPEHDWVRIDGDEATFGVTWYAQDSLGDIVVYLPPAAGDAFEAGAEYGELESVKAVSGVIAPLPGRSPRSTRRSWTRRRRSTTTRTARAG